MAIYSLWGSAASDICEDGDTFLELVSDINACLRFKKKKNGISMKMFVCEIMWRWGYANNFDLPKQKAWSYLHKVKEIKLSLKLIKILSYLLW